MRLYYVPVMVAMFVSLILNAYLVSDGGMYANGIHDGAPLGKTLTFPQGHWSLSSDWRMADEKELFQCSSIPVS